MWAVRRCYLSQKSRADIDVVLGPVTDVTSTEMACGTGNPGPVNGIAQVDAGSEVKFKMSPWVHRSA